MSKPQPDDLEAAAGAGTAAAGEEKPAEAKPKKVAEEEDPRLRWAFVRKVYFILALQFALTAAIAATACFVRAVPRFFVSGRPRAAAWAVYIAILVSPLIGTVVLQATILTAAAVIGLTLFTFWAIKRGCDFTFMFPFLFTSLLVLLVYITIQIFFPLGRVGMTIYGFIATLVFCGFIVFDTTLLLKRHTYNEYVIAAISLYLDVINLFMAQLSLSIQ